MGLPQFAQALHKLASFIQSRVSGGQLSALDGVRSAIVGVDNLGGKEGHLLGDPTGRLLFGTKLVSIEPPIGIKQK